MIEEKQLVEVGKFLRPHALKGELNATLDIDPVYFSDGNPMIVNIEGAFVPFYIQSIRGKGNSGFLVLLDGITSQEDARFLVNQPVYADKETLKEYMADEDEEMMLESDLVGLEVIDEEFGPIGRVKRVDDSTANLLFVIETNEGEEIFIPVADDFIISVNQEEGLIITRLPRELIELNR